MFSKALAHVRRQWMGALALFLVLTGGVAYAVDTVGSADVINNSLLSEDLKNDKGVKSVDVTDGSLTGADVADGSLGGAAIDEATLFNDDSLDATDVSNASTLGGAEINESSLSTVPSASKVANQAIQRFEFNADNGSGATGGGSIGSGDLHVVFSCEVATGDLELSMSTSVDNASLGLSDHDSYFDVEDFDIASGRVDILKGLGADSDEIIDFVYVNGSGFGAHKVVTGQFQILDQAPVGTQSECVVAGHAIYTV